MMVNHNVRTYHVTTTTKPQNTTKYHTRTDQATANAHIAATLEAISFL